MSTSRAESQQPPYGRRRSNTSQSILRPLLTPTAPPLVVGDSKVLNSWVHDVKESTSVIFNHSWWPGVVEGDILSVSAGSDHDSFLFVVPKDDGVPKPIAEAFGLRNNSEVIVTKVDKEKYSASYVELSFQDQYLGRNDMWRLNKHLVDQCIYTDQEVSFIGSIVANIHCIYVGEQKVRAACMTSRTKVVYRSLSAKVTIFIQVCLELWEFAGDGERYNEKVVHSFLPALFAKWQETGTNHTVTICLISRVYYDESEILYAAGPLRRDEGGNWYKDFYKVITDLEVLHEWKPTLVSLKNSFWTFQRDILLTHHYHRAPTDPSAGKDEPVRLVGKLSYAHDGPILEALNLNLYPTETHYIDRSLGLTGASTIMITPGTGYFRVSKQLLRLTTNRMLDQGFELDLVSLAKAPLHSSPIFSFQGHEPKRRTEIDNLYGSRATDPLWGADDEPNEGSEKTTFWWEPFWVSMSFWDEQVDLPFRQDRFVARAKMHEIQMLGLLEHDVLATIEVPFLPGNDSILDTTSKFSKADAEKFDLGVFSLKTESKRPSITSSERGIAIETSQRSASEKRAYRTSLVSPKITSIEETPTRIIHDLPAEGSSDLPTLSAKRLSSSPSQSSIHSLRSIHSTNSMTLIGSGASTPRNSITSRLTPSWLFKPFRSGPSEPQTTTVSASASSHTLPATTSSPPARTSPLSRAPGPSSRPAAPVAIKSPLLKLNRSLDEDPLPPGKVALLRRSPLNTPPKEDHFARRRSMNPGLGNLSSSPTVHTNPSRLQVSTSHHQASLAARWQHSYPLPVFKHEIKWASIVTPCCLPLTVEYFPTASELENSYDVFSYDFVVDPREMRSFLVNPPSPTGNADGLRKAWALVVMRGMAAVRLAQGFQFVIQRENQEDPKERVRVRRSQSFIAVDEDMIPRPKGAAEVLQSTHNPVYLSMSNEIHRISYTGEAIQVRRYVRRMPPIQPFDYQCLIWPKLGEGYTEQKTVFKTHGLENYGWNRLDMTVAGYENQLNESLRYWRTRFVVIPTLESPTVTVGPSGEKLNDEEARILGMEKLQEQFTKLKWQPQDEKEKGLTTVPTRFLPTTLSPAASVLDENLMAQLDQIHAAGPLRKKLKSEREIGEMTLAAIAKAMREEDGVPIKHNHWHRTKYPDSFTGFDFVSWLAREFRDVNSRVQGVEWGNKLQAQGLFEHVRGHHNFLDGHYFYRLKPEFAVPSTPSRTWFRSRHGVAEDTISRPSYYPSSVSRLKNSSPRRNKKRLILSQSMVIDIDPNQHSDQAETVVLHHDIIHNPTTVFHFELQWVGTTARYIEDQLRQWNKTIERYGLKLVEAYVSQIGDIRERNAFQSCFPIRLAVAPPIVPDLHARVPEGTLINRYFEYALLKRFGFIIDVEAADLYPEQIDVIYSYRRSPFKYSQFVHRTGVAFVQVLGGRSGFLFLTNRLMGPGRMGTALKSKDHRPAAEADKIRTELFEFCSKSDELNKFYDEELALLGHAPEEPPPLSI
ncbi:hypothetical protein K435DRAFT_821688 [Dendrothele bispora CBS 962.96]|uniref:Vacuolar membrane-associated protein IML1 n=1 Tax=Dendrothele bispora (strain CBS 962.96) TaxID=1314807 RepID=A0A4S8LFJ6_DENBC|nr:hypothetical protein K435DRAFT_821958 [Dendrothele bispora CBS 962.96]THU88432.1 hypothetical protein K435DRAFT_821688 [Dendrothele bispora CBS 962.96]